MDQQRFLTLDEVAQRLGVTTSTAYRLVKKGKLPGFKVGGQWRFTEALLDSWVVDQVTIEQLKANGH